MPIRSRVLVISLLLSASLWGGPASANDLAPPPVYAPGTRTFATAELRVPRPDVKPCVVELFGSHEFVGDKPLPFAYAPPADCPGPWSKVVIEADYNVSAGRQFDRTAIINIGGVNLYFGTTMEPRHDIAPAWHAERDITDYASLLAQAHDGETLLVNYVDATYTGHIHGRARLLFYPAATAAEASGQPGFVVPLSAHIAKLSQNAPVLDTTMHFPRNLERLALDLINEPQADDEFWYGCTDDRFAINRRDICGGGALRETEVFIDGHMAGVAPVYPWIYTGGINPYLWFPIPGIETVNFSPYRVDLTPIVGLLNDGKEHRIRIGIVGLRNYAFVTGTLLGWRDPGSDVVSGKLTADTLQPARLSVDDHTLKLADEGLNGRMLTRASHDYEIAGYVDTSHGRVATRIRQSIRFSNDQRFETGANVQHWGLRQSTDVMTRVDTTSARGVSRMVRRESFPLDVDDRLSKSHGDVFEDLAAHQGLTRDVEQVTPTGRTLRTTYDVTLAPRLHARIDPKSHATHEAHGSSVETVRATTPDGGHYARTITSKDNVIVATVDHGD